MIKHRKIQMWQNSERDKIQKLKKNLTQKQKCDKHRKSKHDKKIQMWQNPKTQNVAQLKNPKCDKPQKLKMWQN